MQVNVAFCRTMQERVFPIGTNLTQGNLGLFRTGRSETRTFLPVQTGHVGMFDKEKPLRELALTSTANFKSLLPINNTQMAHLWQGRWRHECNFVSQWLAGRH